MTVILLILLSASAGRAGANDTASDEVLVDEVVAQVNRYVITRTELEQEAWMILVERKGEEGLERSLTDEYLAQVLDFLINQRVLLDEGTRLGLPMVSDRERQNLVDGFKRRFKDPEDYAHFLFDHGLDDATIGEILVRHTRVARMRENKLRLLSAVSDEAVAEYYQKHRARFGGAALATVADAIRVRLQSGKRDQELARWVWELRKRSEVRVLVGELTRADER